MDQIKEEVRNWTSVAGERTKSHTGDRGTLGKVESNSTGQLQNWDIGLIKIQQATHMKCKTGSREGVKSNSPFAIRNERAS